MGAFPVGLMPPRSTSTSCRVRWPSAVEAVRCHRRAKPHGFQSLLTCFQWRKPVADLWQDYFVKRRFQALEITQVPMPITDPEYWHWGPLSQAHYEKEYLVGNFLVREYLLDRDEFAYKVVRRENFLKYYLKEEPNAQQIPCPETNDGSARSRVESPRGQEESSQSDSGGRGEGV